MNDLKTTILLSVCTHRTIDVDSLTSVINLFGNSKYSITWCPVRGDALISRARSRIASYFLKERTEDILFFIDDDIVFDKEDFNKIIENIQKGAAVCGAMYVQKGTLNKTCVLAKDETVTFNKDSKLKEVDAIATGFMGIHRRVLEKMAREGYSLGYPSKVEYDNILEYYNFFNPFMKQLEDGRKTELSEDWAFCERARKLGFNIVLDPSIFLGHKGEYLYTLGDKVRLKDKKLSLKELKETFSITLK